MGNFEKRKGDSKIYMETKTSKNRKTLKRKKRRVLPGVKAYY